VRKRALIEVWRKEFEMHLRKFAGPYGDIRYLYKLRVPEPLLYDPMNYKKIMLCHNSRSEGERR